MKYFLVVSAVFIGLLIVYDFVDFVHFNAELESSETQAQVDAVCKRHYESRAIKNIPAACLSTFGSKQ